MSTTVNHIPIDLFGRGFLKSDQLTFSDIPVSYNSRMMPAIEFFTKHLQKTNQVNKVVNNLWLGKIYGDAGGGVISNGELIGALIMSGFPFERTGAGAVFGITTESAKQTEEKYSVTYITQLPKTNLMFPGRKTFNSLTLTQKASILRDYLKLNHYPKPFTYGYLLNKSSGIAIKFMSDPDRQILSAEALLFEDAVVAAGLSEPTIVQSEAQAF